MFAVITLIFAASGFIMGYNVDQRKTRTEVKECAVVEVQTNHVSAEEAIMRCR